MVQDYFINDAIFKENVLVEKDLTVTGTFGITTLSATSAIIVDTFSSTPALRVTQRGTGNVLLVEDNTNPDATSFLIDSNGTIVVGASAASTKNLSRKGFQFVTDNYLPSRIIELRSHAVTVPGAGLDFNAQLDFVRTSSGNSNDYSTSFILSPYDALGGITFKGGNSTGTSIYCQNKYNSFSGNVSGSILTIRNHVARTNSLYSILTLDEDKVGIGTTSPNELLTVAGNVSAYKYYGDGSELTNIVSTSIDTGVRAITGDWQNTFTTVSSFSGDWGVFQRGEGVNAIQPSNGFNQAISDYSSIVGGKHAVTSHEGEIAFSNSRFNNLSGSFQKSFFTLSTTTDSSNKYKNLALDGVTSYFEIPNNTIYYFNVNVTGFNIESELCNVYFIKGFVKSIGNTLTLSPFTIKEQIEEDINLKADVNIDNTNKTLSIQVTGSGDITYWGGSLDTIKIKY